MGTSGSARATGCGREDYAAAGEPLAGLFVHELTHVWQHQRGLFLPLRRHPFCRYAYRIVPGRPLERYGIEQQAEIVRHAWAARTGARAADPALEALLPVHESGPALLTAGAFRREIGR